VRADACVQRELTALDEFCSRLRALPACSAAVFVFIIEANLDWTRAKMLAEHAAPRFGDSRYGRAVTVCEDPNDQQRPGVWMLNQRKNQMNQDANFFMVLGKLHILPVEHKTQALVSVGSRENCLTTLKMFEEQLKGYRRKIDRPSTDTSKECKARYTGKSAGTKDDMVIAFQLALTWGMAFMNDPDSVGPYNQQPECIITRARPNTYNEVYTS